MSIDKEALAALPLAELRQLAEMAEQSLFDRKCQSTLQTGAPCTAEPPHADGWHENRGTTYAAVAYPAYTASAQPAEIRWRFMDDVVAREHEHEAQRRPGAN
jgi:hypothetical protein